MKNLYKVYIRNVLNERTEVIVEADGIEGLAKSLHGRQLTFLPKRRAEYKSFSIMTASIVKMEFELCQASLFESVAVYTVFATE